MKLELDLSNYLTIADLKNAAGVHTSKFARKFDLANLKSNGDKIGFDKLKNIPTNLSNIKRKADKFDVHKLVPFPNDLSDLVKKWYCWKKVYNAKIKKIEDKKPDITKLAANASLNAKLNEFKGNLTTNASLNAKINEVKNEIPNITNLATTTALAAVEIKYLIWII